MTAETTPSNSNEIPREELASQLNEALTTVKALLNGQVDAVMTGAQGTPLLLHEAQQALLRSEARLKESQRIAHLGNWEWNLDTNQINLSEEASQIFGLSATSWAKTFSHEDFLNLVHTDDRNRLRAAVKTSLRSKTIVNADFRAVLTSGEERYVYGQGRVICDNAGTPLRMVGTVQDITDRKRIEVSLKEREALFSSAQRVAGIGIWDYDVKHDQLKWSDETHRIFGISPNSFGGNFDSFFRLVHPDDMERLRPISSAPPQDGSPVVCEYRICRPDGQVCHVYERGEVTFDDSGQPIRKMGVVMDITERKLQEEALRESEQHFRATFEQAAVGVMHVDVQGRFIRVNEKVSEILGYSTAELIGMTFASITHPDDVHEGLENARRMLGGDPAPYSTEKRYFNKSGAVIWVNLNTRLLRGAGGEPKYFISVVQDVTDRKRVEAMAQQMATVVEASHDAIIAITPEGLIIAWNPAAEKMYGYPAEEIIGQPVNVLIPLEGEIQLTRLLDDAARGNSTDSLETIHINRDGKKMHVSLTASPIRDAAGRVSSIATIVRDITEKLHSEMQLRQAMKMEAIGRLAGGIAHDFNNLLTVVIGRCALVLKKLKNDEFPSSDVALVKKTAERAAKLTKQMLQFSRQQVIKPVVLDINKCIQDVGEMLRQLLGEDVKLIIELDSRALKIQMDLSQLQQIVMNLSVNAREAMPNGGFLRILTSQQEIKEADLRTFPELKTGLYARICIRDTGTGIDESIRGRMFEPFFTTKSTGTGLGLPTVYGIVKQNGGEISIESEVGKGSEFIILLPLVSEQADHGSGHLPAIQHPGSETILLVEDSVEILSLFVESLSENGYKVLSASDGAGAIRISESTPEPIHMLITDVIMPGMNGKELADYLHAKRPAMKIVYMSGYTHDLIAQRGVLNEGVVLLDKPIDPDTLLRRIREILSSTV